MKILKSGKMVGSGKGMFTSGGGDVKDRDAEQIMRSGKDYRVNESLQNPALRGLNYIGVDEDVSGR